MAGILRHTLAIPEAGHGGVDQVVLQGPGGDACLRLEHKKKVRAEQKRRRREEQAAVLGGAAHRMSQLVAARVRGDVTNTRNLLADCTHTFVCLCVRVCVCVRARACVSTYSS